MPTLAGLNIAICKPDHGIVGGFERVVTHLADNVTSRGARMTSVSVDAYEIGRRLRSSGASEVEVYEATARAFGELDLSAFDLVISTQPPSFAVQHPHHLSVFYHHLRIYYDLADAHRRSFRIEPERFAREQQRVHQFDQALLDGVGHILAGSREIASRLARYNNLSANVSLFTAGPSISANEPPSPVPAEGPILCVSRMEWPKRTELAVQAVALHPERQGVFVGSGGRRSFNEELAILFESGAVNADAVDDEDLWLHGGRATATGPVPARYKFRGNVTDTQLDQIYRDAMCVVAPAYREDYGLTAIETMMRGRPLIVCNDGGGLCEFIEHGETGIIVEPTGRAIADAVALLQADHDLAQRLGSQAYEASRSYDWPNAIEQFDRGIEAVMSS